jgi:hypothetical protein
MPIDVAAREGIRDLVARYNYFGDAGRTDEVAGLFAVDGVLELVDADGSHRHEGRDEILRFLDSVKADWLAEAEASGAAGRVFHGVTTHVIDMSTERTAQGHCYVSLLRHAGLAEWGRYRDGYVLTDEGWRFAFRKASRDGVLHPDRACDRD